jgi:hypothetical protein
MPTKLRNSKALTPQEREDERDYQLMRRSIRTGKYTSFRKFARALGYEIKDRKRR